MSTDDVRVEVDRREVRFVRSEAAARALGCKPLEVVQISALERAVALPSPDGGRYLRVFAGDAAAPEDPLRDPLTAVFPRKRAADAERVASIINRNAAVDRGEIPAVTGAPMDDKTMKALNRATSLAMWTSTISLVLMVVPLVIFLGIVVLILIAVF